MKIEVYPKEQFLERRKKGIGGSDVGAIMNVSVFKSALDVYCDKLGLVDPVEPSFAMRMGNRMESAIKEEYLLQNESSLTHTEDAETKAIITKGDYYYYHPDGLIINDGVNIGLWEAKYSTRYDAWGMVSEEIPLEYQYQVQWGMFLSNLDFCTLSLIIGREYRQFEVLRDDKVIKQLKTAVDKFWNDYVLTSTPPPPSEKKSDEELLRALYADDATTFTADVEIVELADEFLGLKDEIDRLESTQQEIRNKIQAKMKNSNICLSDYFKISWKQSKDRVKTDWKKAFDHIAKHLIAESEGNKDLIAEILAEYISTSKGSRPFSVKRLK